ncbi:MAG: diaminopimelate epimerase, partial [Candidatus Dadabacteria bacterium]
MTAFAPLAFAKLHGLGNDFVIVAAEDWPEDIAAFARFVADRHYGIGCDQLLVCAPASTPEADIRMDIYNGDGSRA